MSEEAKKENQNALESTACHSHKGTQMNDRLRGQGYLLHWEWLCLPCIIQATLPTHDLPACALKVCALQGSLCKRAESKRVDVVLILVTFRPHKCDDTFFFPTSKYIHNILLRTPQYQAWETLLWVVGQGSPANSLKAAAIVFACLQDLDGKTLWLKTSCNIM